MTFPVSLASRFETASIARRYAPGKCLLVRELPHWIDESFREFRVRLFDLADEHVGDGGEGAAQLSDVERANERAGHGDADLRRQPVEAATVDGRQAVPHAGQSQHLVAHTA